MLADKLCSPFQLTLNTILPPNIQIKETNYKFMKDYKLHLYYYLHNTVGDDKSYGLPKQQDS
jgi:hypothetical protein